MRRIQTDAYQLAGADRGCCAKSKRGLLCAFLEEPAIEPAAIQRPLQRTKECMSLEENVRERSPAAQLAAVSWLW